MDACEVIGGNDAGCLGAKTRHNLTFVRSGDLIFLNPHRLTSVLSFGSILLHAPPPSAGLELLMSDTPVSDQERREAEVVSRHLPEGFSAEPDVVSGTRGDASASAPDLTEPEQQDSLRLQGGDIHRNIFRIDARAKLHKRAATYAAPTRKRSASNAHEISATEQQAPGGFRRQYVQRRQKNFATLDTPVTRSFVDFLDLYGSFAGEDLAESEDQSALEDEEEGQDERSGETRPLLGRRKSSRRARAQGDAGVSRSFFTLLKAFIGTGIMFLPKAFNNGGILFSSITLLIVAMLSTLAFHLLLQCRKRYGGGYGELGEAIGGPKFRRVILASITLSQLGFVCAGTIFIAENLKSFLEAASNGNSPLSTNLLIGMQLVLLIPLALIRNISKLGPAAMVADVFILIGLVYIWWYDISTIAANGLNKTVVLFNPEHFTLTIGSAIFTFEGIGLVLPIQSSMKEPEKFGKLLFIVMIIITIIFTSVGLLCYATFGADTYIEVISNFPQDSKLVNAVQCVYALAVLVGTPVQLFPAIRIIEGALFGHRSGKQDSMTKWKKNGFRSGIVILCGVISILGASNLDRFVALIGSFACVPLVYIYPALLHYKGIAESRWVGAGDILFMVVGFVAMVYTTCITLARWGQS